MKKEGKYLYGSIDEIAEMILKDASMGWNNIKFNDFDFMIADVDMEENETIREFIDAIDGAWYGIKYVNAGFDSDSLTLVGDRYDGGGFESMDLWQEPIENNKQDLIELIINVLAYEQTVDSNTRIIAEIL